MAFNKIIDSFSGEYRWLSNFWIHDEILSLSVEHYYQAAKATNVNDYLKILNCKTPKDAKHMGKIIKCRYDWNDVKLIIMEECVKQKFTFNETLANKLLDTKNALLVEGNYWGDTFWGMCDGKGENNLGKILMRIRDEYL